MQPDEPAIGAGDSGSSLRDIEKERSIWRTWAPWAFMVGFITAFVAIFASLGEQLHDGKFSQI
jgi:hypothetical protein